MPWVITAVISWIVFFVLVDVRQLKKTIFGGLLTITMASMVDWGGHELNLYQFYDEVIPWAGNSMFYIFGPVFTMGTLFTQYLPVGRVLQLINILVVSLLYLSVEALILQTQAAEYIHWHILASFLVDIGAFTILTWVAQTFQLSSHEAAFNSK